VDGGWDASHLDVLLAPYASEVVTREEIAEEGTDPSCYLFTVRKSGAEPDLGKTA